MLTYPPEPEPTVVVAHREQVWWRRIRCPPVGNIHALDVRLEHLYVLSLVSMHTRGFVVEKYSDAV